MLAKFKINRDVLDNNRESVASSLRNKYGLKLEELVETMETREDWFVALDIEVLKKTIMTFEDYKNILNIEIVEHENVDFEYCDSMKKLFLLDLSEGWVSDLTEQSAINALQSIEASEIKYGKCATEFDASQIKQSMVDLLGDMRYHRLRNRINVISKLQKFYEKHIEIEAEWEDFKAQKEISEILGQEFQEYVLTKKDLIDLYKGMANVQESVIPILIFEGVRVSKIDDEDELRYLKKSDFLGNKLVIGGNGKKARREITLDSDISDIVKQAIDQEYSLKMIKHEPCIAPLEDTEYIIRKIISSRKRKDTSYDADVMSFRGVYGRINTCKSHLEALLYDIPFSPQSIATCGKVYYINRYIAEGMDVYDAVRKTLVRFGTWYGDPEEDKKEAQNIQLVNRLKKVWSAYAK